MKKKYVKPTLTTVIVEMENGIAAGSGTVGDQNPDISDWIDNGADDNQNGSF